MKLNKEFVEKLKHVLLSQGINKITFDLDVFDDMDEDEYFVFKSIYNRYIENHDSGESV
jgi:hypothetical protein